MALHLRIGELARRTGVNPALLRAWERRYGLIEPARSDGGFRLYSERDEQRVRAMVGHLSRGVAAAEAAQLARAEEPVGAEPERSLLDALLAFDETAAHAAFDRLLADLGRDAVLRDGVLPTLRAIGDGWERGDVTIAQEHFASGMLRGRLLGLARGWDRGSGPRALLAAPSGERHDLGLIVFGLALRELGWRVTLLGADTPLPTLREAADRLMPAVVVIAALEPAPLERAAAELAELGAAVRVVLAGGGATRAIAVAAGAGLLPDDPFEAAEMLAASAA